MADGRCHVLRLPSDLIRDILDHLDADPDRLVDLDRRGYLSQESFALPPPPEPDAVEDIANFRLVCKTFSTLGAVHQFTRISTRFSRKGFDRLEQIAAQDHLAKHVRKFSYLVPHFYVEGRDHVRRVLPTLAYRGSICDVSTFEAKAAEQRHIVDNQVDARVLSRAVNAFTSLQHIQILRLQDRGDTALLALLRTDPALARYVDLRWEPACSHCAKTLGTALLTSDSPCSRVSIPALAVQNPGAIAAPVSPSVRMLATNLKSLELHFDEGFDLHAKMQSLSAFFKELFNTAKSMQAIHIGFPSHRPLELRLEDIFHHVQWDRLSAFGIQAWKLDSDEIISLLKRHRHRLRGVRLRDVLLNEGSRWTDILAFLRGEMPQLDWVSLRRIGYTETFDRQWVGAEIPDDPPGGASESDQEDDTDRDSSEDGDGALDASDDDSDTSSAAHSDDDGVPPGYEMDFPPLSPSRHVHRRQWSQDNLLTLPLDELGDDGVAVSNAQRKLWEAWAVAR